MKVTTQTVATREVELTIEPEVAFIEKAMRQAARRISRVRPVAGFRPGKAPYAMVERAFGRELILNEALRETGDGLFGQAVSEAHIEPYDSQPPEVVSTDPVVLKVRVPLMPVTTLGDYKALHITPEPPVTLDDADVDHEVDLQRRRHAEYAPVERGVEIGDQIVVTIKGTADNQELVVDRKSSTMMADADMTPPGFAEAILGMKAGDARQFALSYPADFGDEHLAGKMVSFDVTVETVRQVNLPALDDEFAKTVGDYATAAEMREKLAQRLKERREAEARAREQSAALEALVAVSSVEYPAAAVETEIGGILETRKARLRQIGFEFAKYLQMVNKTEAQMRDEVRPEAERSLVRQSVIHQFGIAEGLSVKAEDLNAQLDRMAASYGERAAEMRKQLDENRVRLSVYVDMMQESAIQRLTDLLTGRIQPTADKPAEAPAAAETPAAEAATDK